MLKDRQKFILEAVIEEYIKTARPVASREIVRHFRFDLSPATMRNEMQELDEMGFLEQPHTSSGRIPTDKGYRFFVDEFMHRENKDTGSRLNFPSGGSGEEFLREMARSFAKTAHSFTILGIENGSAFEKSGFSEIMNEPEFLDAEFARNFGLLADEIEEELEDIFADIPAEKQPQVFIGSENPIRSARHCGMIVSRTESPSRQKIIITTIGPKRMDYRKNLTLIDKFLRV